MRIKEFRILMPLTVDEYRIGQLYSTCEMSRNETGGGDGVEVIIDEPFTEKPLWEGKYSEGQYTFKKYYAQYKVNAFIRKIAPKGSLEFEEYAWNAYPYCRTIIRNESYMKDGFEIKVETIHAQDQGTQENAHHLSEEELKIRKIVHVDITDKNFPYKNDEKHLDEFKSFTTNRGPLGPNWAELAKADYGRLPGQAPPLMCCYKLVTVHFKWFGLQRTVENMILRNQKKLFGLFNRRVFLWIDKWHSMTIDQVREFETSTKDDLDRARHDKERRGTAMS